MAREFRQAVGLRLHDEAALKPLVGPGLDTLEVNPLWVRGEQVEALDALAVWSEEAQP